MKKNTVKIFALCFAAILALGAFASCGAEKTETGADIQQNNASLDGTVNTGATKLTKTEAQDIAFNHFGVKADDCKITENELDDDGNYEIEFICNDREYDIEVNATTGAITEIDVEKEDDDDKKKPATTTPAPAKKLTAEEAKEKAFAHFGVKAENVRGLEFELDDDGHYEIEFEVGNMEYSIDIALDGTVLESEKEYEDD